jgi:hypothetical protein
MTKKTYKEPAGIDNMLGFAGGAGVGISMARGVLVATGTLAHVFNEYAPYHPHASAGLVMAGIVSSVAAGLGAGYYTGRLMAIGSANAENSRKPKAPGQ